MEVEVELQSTKVTAVLHHRVSCAKVNAVAALAAGPAFAVIMIVIFRYRLKLTRQLVDAIAK